MDKFIIPFKRYSKIPIRLPRISKASSSGVCKFTSNLERVRNLKTVVNNEDAHIVNALDALRSKKLYLHRKMRLSDANEIKKIYHDLHS